MGGRVYLAGRIHGLTYEEAMGWRTHARRILTMHNVEPLNPMRDKGELASKDTMPHQLPATKFSDKAVVTRDLLDLRRSDLMIVHNVRGAVGRGTMFEMGYAAALEIPVLWVGKWDEDESPFITATVSLRFDVLDEALHYAAIALGG